MLPGLGTFKHEAATVDESRQHVYLSEDEGDGRFYRFTPAAWPDLAVGDARGRRGPRRWLGRVARGARRRPRTSKPTRQQAPQSTAFDGGEGCFYADGVVLLTTKGDNRVWAYDVEAARMRVLYDAATFNPAPLTGVDNVIVHTAVRRRPRG